MNKYIEVVKKWLADPQSVTQDELEANARAAYDAVAADNAAYYAAEAAAYAAWSANAATNAAVSIDRAKYWVKRYEELVNEKS